MQVDRTELIAAVAGAHKRGILTERLAVLAMGIARGYLASEKFKGYSEADREDIFGAWTVRFVKTWSRLDPEKNCHAYITRGVELAWKDHARSTSRRLRREHAKAEAMLAEETDRIQRFVRSYEAELGDGPGIVPMEDFERKIKH
jgi:DNA-directed RNA polymerase specialized sigma subunit